jgi:hypothetical protein
MTDETRLLIRVEDMSYASLEKAMSYGVNALNKLPETPVSAAGLNVNYECADSPLEFAELLAGRPDELLANISSPPKVVGRAVVRSLEFGSGQLNLSLSTEGESSNVKFNFHLPSTDPIALTKWLSTPIGEVRGFIETLLGTFNLTPRNPPMPPTDSESLRCDTRSLPADGTLPKRAETLPSTVTKSDTRSVAVVPGATVPSSISAGSVWMRYNPQRVRPSRTANGTQP